MAPPLVTITRIELAAPASIDPDGSAQLTLTAIKSDGSSEDVTTRAQWTTSDARVLQIAPGGMVLARTRGEADIAAIFQVFRSTARIFVLPSGTFRLRGQVREAGLPLQRVSVSVTAGTGTGLAVMTDDNGRYSLYGVGGGIRLAARRDGYRDRIEDLHVMEHQTLDFEMTPSRDRQDLSGTYALDIEAASCPSELPDEARRRSYLASVEHAGPRVHVRLSGADFIVVKGRGDRFSGFAAPDDTVRFTIGGTEYSFYYYAYYGGQFDIAERFSETTTLIVNGTVDARITGRAISGILNGTIALSPRIWPPFWPRSPTCSSGDHRFDMRR